MNIELQNVRIFGRAKEDLFDVKIESGVIASIFRAGTNRENQNSIDLDGGWLAPGFIDAHVHVTNTGVQHLALDTSQCGSYDEMSSILSRPQLAETVQLGHGWDDSKWNRKADINVFSEKAPPTYISRVDAHSALVSKALIKLACAKFPAIPKLAGFSETQPLTAEAHGVIREFAYSLISQAKRKEFISSAIQNFLGNGIVEIHEMAGPKISSFQDAQLVAEISKSSNLSTKIWWGELNGHEAAKQLNAFGCGGDLFIDGSFGSKTALISNNYIDGTAGRKYIDTDAATEHILAGYEFGFPTSFHAIGDDAIEIAIAAFEKAQSFLGKPNFQKLQHQIEHAEMLHEQQIQRGVDLQLVFSMQPQFSALWGGENGMYEERIGERWKILNPFHEILKNGGRIVFGSDSPVTDPNPWLSIAAATNMHNPEHSISYKAAFKAHTTNSVRSAPAFDVGYPANIAVWEVSNWHKVRPKDNRNRWSSDARSFPIDFPDAQYPPKCLLTMVNGEISYSKVGQ